MSNEKKDIKIIRLDKVILLVSSGEATKRGKRATTTSKTEVVIKNIPT